MSARVSLVVVGLAIAGIVAWLWLRDDPSPAANPDPRPLTSDSHAPINAPAGPSVPAIADAAAPALPAVEAPPADDTFTAEPRDAAWAAPTEREIARRFGKLRGGSLASTECRRTQCRLVLTGSEAELADTIAELEGPRGMHGFATNVLLTAPAKQRDGSIELRAYLLFDRPE